MVTTKPSKNSPLPDAFLAQCPSRAVLARVGEKWTTLALVALEPGAARFGALKRRLEGVSQKMLTQTLRALERDGLIVRRAYDEMPLRVEYAVTARGRELVALAMQLKRWAERRLPEIERANAAYDRRNVGAMKDPDALRRRST
jgi:DNA-binding HxlR family transcriptional regulator